MEDARERLIRYLDDAWAVEKALVASLEEMAHKVNDLEVKALFMEHRQVTHQQEEALEERIRALGEEPSGSKGFFTQVMGKVGDFLHKAKDDYDQTSQELMKAFATENFECAMYESLEAYAKAIGDTETAKLARMHMQQEKDAADEVWQMIRPAAERPAEGVTYTGVNAAA